MVIDFRKLNEKTISDKYPMPDISVILANLGKSKYFSTLDLKAGFHQIMLDEKDRQKTVFSVNNGKYEFCRLPFGLKNAPIIFQRTIDDVLRLEVGKTCQVYMDDIIIHSPDEYSHLKHLETIMQKLEKAGMIKVKAILEFETTKSLKSLRSFLGLSGYYKRFVKDYTKVAKPLTRYLKGENG